MGQRLREVAVLPPDSGPLTAARMAKALRTRPSDRGQRPAEGPGLGNAALARAHAGRVQPKLAVSEVEDPLEREAEAFSARVVAQTALRRPVQAPDSTVDAAAAARLAVVRRAGVRAADTQSDAASFKGLARQDVDGGPGAAGADSAGPVGAGPGAAGPEVTPSLESYITGVSGGDPLAEGLRERIEPVLGADLSGVRVHTDDRSAAAAAQLQARAFTFGKDILLGAGESPADLALMAHESTHVVQQGAVEVYRLFDFIGDAAKEAVADLAKEIPGYDLLSQVAGQDLITGRPVRTGRAEFVQALLSHGPFAGAVGPVLQSLDALDQIFDLVRERLAEHNLSLDRIVRDMAAAWEEMDFTSLPGTNVAIAERYINNLLTDVTGFVTAIVNDVIAAIKAAAIHFAEPLTQRPSVKPYWDLGVKIFHHNPLTGEDVDAPTIDILRDLLKLLGKEETLQQMEQRGTLAETAKWLDEQFARFTALRGQAEQLVRDVIDAISPDNLGNLVANLTSLADRALALFTEFRAFAEEVIGKVLELVKNALLGWLAEHANRVPGFYLLTVILGRNPFTGDPVERNATNLIRGFITLLPNGEEVYRQLAESGTIASAAARIEGELARLNITWDMVTGTFRAIWDGLSLNDLLAPIAAFDRIVGQFGEPLSRIIEFASTVLQVVIELILKLMNFPTELLGHIIDNAMAAIEDIKRDPIQFLKNVILALKEGVSSFLGNIANHLLHGLADWLFRGLRGLGIQPPESLTLESIITLVIQVSGVTIEVLWQKLGQRIGEERVALIRRSIDQLGQAWAFLKDIQERGITAVWEFIQGQLSNLWDTLLNTAKDWIMREIIDKVTARLLSMLDPTGVMAVVNSAVAFFDVIRSAIEYIREILEIVDRYVSTLAAVARGDTGPGAAMLEQGLAQAIPVAIGFLANMLHLGDVPEKVRDIIVNLRHLIDEAIDWLLDQAMALGRAALEALGLGQDDKDPETGPTTRAANRLTEELSPGKTPEEIQPIVSRILEQLRPAGLSALELRGPTDDGEYEIYGAASPFVQLIGLATSSHIAVTMQTTITLDQQIADPDEVPSGGTYRAAERDDAHNIILGPDGKPNMIAVNMVPSVGSVEDQPVRSRTYRGSQSQQVKYRSGGLIAPPKAGDQAISVLTFNTAEDSSVRNNSTHAERQLQAFLQKDATFARRVTTIVSTITDSPCSQCSDTLNEITELTPNATSSRTLKWTKPYTNPLRPTTDASLAMIKGWIIEPSTVGTPAKPPLKPSKKK